jgi:hypothetical protein
MNTNKSNINNTNNNSNTKIETAGSAENVTPKLKMPKIAIPIGLSVFGLIIILFFLLFNQGFTTTNTTDDGTSKEITKDIFIILTFTIIGIAIIAILLPNFADVKKLLEQIMPTFYVFIYTIFFILLFVTLPTKLLDNYGYIITPITLLLTGFMFYKGSISNYVEHFNITYERIKTLVLFFCLIAILIVYYSIDPGGLIKKYFGHSLILTTLLAVFSFLYLIIVLTLPDTLKVPSKTDTNSNFLENFSKFSVYGSILFILFIIAVTIGILYYPGGLFQNKQIAASVITLILTICIIWGIGLIINLFPEISDKQMNVSKMSLFKKSLISVFGIVISGLLIAWLVYNLQNLSGRTGTTSFILNLLLVITILALVYKTINVQLPSGNNNKNAFFSLILNLVLYIPCLFSKAADKTTGVLKEEQTATDMTSICLLLFAILLTFIYYKYPSIAERVTLQGGELLVNKPVDMDKLYSLASYQDLNGSEEFEYQYGLSCWIFIDSMPPNTRASYTKYTSLLNYGNKPNILYKADTNTLMITMEQKGLTKYNSKMLDFDENGHRIIYKKEGILLQKWNNIVINYNGGTLDIFYNNELVKSAIEVVPYMTLDSLTIGSDNGIIGGICNVVYFNRPLTVTNMYILYNMVKDKTPPLTTDTNKTIVSKYT